MRTRFDARARDLGLTRAQWGMVANISASEGATQSELAAQLEINSVTAGRILDKLESTGLIERRANPADRRENRIYLKASAKPLMSKLGDMAAQEMALALQGIDEAQQALLLGMLQQMIGNLNSAPPPGSTTGQDEAAETAPN